MTVAEARHNSNTSVWLKACDVAFEPRVASLRKALRAPSDFNWPSAASRRPGQNQVLSCLSLLPEATDAAVSDFPLER